MSLRIDSSDCDERSCLLGTHRGLDLLGDDSSDLTLYYENFAQEPLVSIRPSCSRPCVTERMGCSSADVALGTVTTRRATTK